MHATSLKHHIKHLEVLHQDLDKRIDGLEKNGTFEDLDLQSLKKKRLHVRDELERCRHSLEDMLK